MFAVKSVNEATLHKHGMDMAEVKKEVLRPQPKTQNPKT